MALCSQGTAFSAELCVEQKSSGHASFLMTRHPWILLLACPCCTVTFWPCGTPPSLSPRNSRPMLVQAAHARVLLLDHVSARSPTVMSSQCRDQNRREFQHRDVFAAPPQRTHSALSHLSVHFSVHLFCLADSNARRHPLSTLRTQGESLHFMLSQKAHWGPHGVLKT